MKSQIEAWIERAKQVEDSPAAQIDTVVEVSGVELSTPIYWQGSQWAVTEYGIEARDGTYAIAGKRVWDNENVLGWVPRMDEKSWVDMPDFVEALRIARKRWPRNPT